MKEEIKDFECAPTKTSYDEVLMKVNICSYEYFLEEDVCRLCWNKEAERDVTRTTRANKREEVKNELVDKIRDCLNLDFKKDSFPKRACIACSSKVEEFYEYKRFCRETDRRLREIIKKFKSDNKTILACEIKTELSTDNDVDNDDSLNHYSVLDDSFGVCDQSYDSTVENETDFIKKPSIVQQKRSNSSTSLLDNLDDNKEYRLLDNTNLIERKQLKKVKKKKKVTERHVPNSKSSINNVDLNNLTEYSEKEVASLNIKKAYKQKRSPTYCNICRIDFVSDEQISAHNALNHGIENGNLFKCFGCEKRFKNRKARLSHELNFCKGLKEGYKCSKCNRFLPRRSMYETHMRDHRENPTVVLPENLFQCAKCCKLFKTNKSLKEHMVAHNTVKKKYVCECCGRMFTRQDYLQKHRLTHTGTKHLACPHCKYRTSQKSSLIIHIRIHTGERPYNCDLCPLRCISSSNLLAHRRRHLGHKAFECSICNKRFGYKNSLEEHIASVHEGSNAFSCEICGAIYTRLRGLRRHLHAKHNKLKVDGHPQTDGTTCADISCMDQATDGASIQKNVSSNNEFLKIMEEKGVVKGNEVFEICY